MFQILLIYIVAYTRFLDLLKDWQRVTVQYLAMAADLCSLIVVVWLFASRYHANLQP